MIRVERYIDRLKELQISTAEGSLKPAPDKQNAYGYGYACGLQAGLSLALEALQAAERDQESE